MTAVESRSFARVVVIAPRTRVDLALPIDVPVVDLLPLLLDLVGERSDDAGGQHGGWKLARVGGEELPSDRTLRSLDVFDGTALHLTPREAAVAPPIYDDVVDAIATTIRSAMSTRSTNPAVGAAVTAVGLVVAAVALYFRGSTNSTTAISLGALAVVLAAAVAVSRGPGDRIIATVTAAGALPFTLVAGIDLVDAGPTNHNGVLLGFAIMLLYSLIALPAIGTGTVVFVSSAIIAVFGAAGALVDTAFDVTPIHSIAGVIAIGVAALAILPWLVVRMSRLPLPFIPTTSSEVREGDEDVDIDQLADRARLADEYLDGGFIGCATVVVFCAAVLAMHGSVLSVLLALACVGAILLRTRTLVSLVPRAAIFSIAAGGALLGGIVYIAFTPRAVADPDTLTAPHPTAVLLAAAGTTALALLLSVIVPRLRLSPSTIRFADFLESFLLISILPLAVGVMNLYSTMRHL